MNLPFAKSKARAAWETEPIVSSLIMLTRMRTEPFITCCYYAEENIVETMEISRSENISRILTINNSITKLVGEISG